MSLPVPSTPSSKQKKSLNKAKMKGEGRWWWRGRKRSDDVAVDACWECCACHGKMDL